MKLDFKIPYFIAFLSLFCIESLIAIYLKDGFIRHTFGDFLVVILIYCFIKAFLDIDELKLALGVLAFSFGIEFLQLANMLSWFNLQDSYALKLVLGSTFHITDLVAYTLGAITIIIFEYKIYTLWTR